MAAYSQWEILRARIPNTDGTPPPHPHPCIYLADSPKFPGRILLLGITSDLSAKVDGYSVELPWAVGGHKESGLHKPCIAQAHWTDHIMPDEVSAVIGYTPKAQQLQIAQALQLRKAREK